MFLASSDTVSDRFSSTPTEVHDAEIIGAFFILFFVLEVGFVFLLDTNHLREGYLFCKRKHCSSKDDVKASNSSMNSKQHRSHKKTPQHRPKGLPKPPVLAVLQAPAANTHLRRHSGRIATRHGKEVDDTVEIDLGNSVDFVWLKSNDYVAWFRMIACFLCLC